MILLAHQIELGAREAVAGVAIEAEEIVDLRPALRDDFRAVLAGVEREELPIPGLGIVALLLLDHGHRVVRFAIVASGFVLLTFLDYKKI